MVRLENPNEHNRQRYRQRPFKVNEDVILEELEASRTNNQIRKSFQEVGRTKGPRTVIFLKTDNGRQMTSNSEVIEKWRGYLDQLLNAQ